MIFKHNAGHWQREPLLETHLLAQPLGQQLPYQHAPLNALDFRRADGVEGRPSCCRGIIQGSARHHEVLELPGYTDLNTKHDVLQEVVGLPLLFVDQEVSVRDAQRVVDEDGVEHVHHAEDHKDHEEGEEQAVEGGDRHERLHELVPVDST